MKTGQKPGQNVIINESFSFVFKFFLNYQKYQHCCHTDKQYCYLSVLLPFENVANIEIASLELFLQKLLGLTKLENEGSAIYEAAIILRFSCHKSFKKFHIGSNLRQTLTSFTLYR